MSEECILYQNRFNDSVTSTKGFEDLLAHVNFTFEWSFKVIELIASRVTAEDVFLKSLARLSKQGVKQDCGTDSIVRVVTEVYQYETTTRRANIEDLRKNCIDPFRELLKKQSDELKKVKSDCHVLIKTRRQNYDDTVKACKLYTQRLRAHETLVKRHAGQDDNDEKIKNKLLKSSTGVKLAEKAARVSSEMLGQALTEYNDIFEVLSAKVEENDRLIVNRLHELLSYYKKCSSCTLSDVDTIYTKLSSLSEVFSAQAYCENFVADKGTGVVFMKYPSIKEIQENGRVEYVVELSAEPSESVFKSNLNNPSTMTRQPRNAPAQSQKANAVRESPSSTTSENDVSIEASSEGQKVVALFDFEAQNADELSFKQGDVITVV